MLGAATFISLPAGWADFKTNYDTLSLLKVPSQFQSVKDHLIAGGQQMLLAADNDLIVHDDDVKQWLYTAGQLAQRTLNNAPMLQVSQHGMDSPEGSIPDLVRGITGGSDVHPVDALSDVANTTKWIVIGGVVLFSAWLFLEARR